MLRHPRVVVVHPDDADELRRTPWARAVVDVVDPDGYKQVVQRIQVGRIAYAVSVCVPGEWVRPLGERLVTVRPAVRVRVHLPWVGREAVGAEIDLLTIVQSVRVGVSPPPPPPPPPPTPLA